MLRLSTTAMSSVPSKLRVLCLHGRGTSAEIFKSQTSEQTRRRGQTHLSPFALLTAASLREELASEMDFVFLDGEWECEPYPGAWWERRASTALLTVWNAPFAPPTDVDKFWQGPYRMHYDTQTGIGLSRAISRIEAFAREHGPFDSIMGFSQGAALAAAVLSWQRDSGESPLFRSGVLMCGGRPTELGSNARWPDRRRSSVASSTGSGASTPSLSSLSSASTPRSLSPGPDYVEPAAAPKLCVPTAHFAGKKDAMYEETLNLFLNADPDTATLWQFDEGHTIPRSSDSTRQMAEHIRRVATCTLTHT